MELMKTPLAALFIACVLVASCAHRGELKSPMQIAKEEASEAAREARTAKQREQDAKKEAERAAARAREGDTSMEVTVPARIY